MAYHELLARVADNYQASRRFDDSVPYEGLHQITADREIDPSLPPLDFRAFNEEEGDWRDGLGAAVDPAGRVATGAPRLQAVPGRRPALPGRHRRQSPRVASSLFVRDRDGNDWVVLDGYMKQVDPLADKGWRGLQQTIAIDTVLITAGEAKAFLAAVPAEPRFEIHDLIDSHGHTDCCYVGEVGRTGPTCYHRHDKPRQVSMGGKPFQVVPTVEQYTWEGNILDCSISESASTFLPSTFLQQSARLSFDMSGPSWLDADGTPVFTYYEEPGNGSRALLVRATFLREFLTTHKLELVALHWFQRMELSERRDGKHPQVQSATEARLSPDLAVYEGKPRREEHDLT